MDWILRYTWFFGLLTGLKIIYARASIMYVKGKCPSFDRY